MNESSSPFPIEVKVTIEGKDLDLKIDVDTGAAVFIISNSTRVKLFPHLKLHPSKVVLRTYTDEPIKVVG